MEKLRGTTSGFAKSSENYTLLLIFSCGSCSCLLKAKLAIFGNLHSKFYFFNRVGSTKLTGSRQVPRAGPPPEIVGPRAAKFVPRVEYFFCKAG